MTEQNGDGWWEAVGCLWYGFWIAVSLLVVVAVIKWAWGVVFG